MSLDAANAMFDSAQPATAEQMMGVWRGEGVQTGHPMDGMLEAAFWHGKDFQSCDRVFPLVHNVPFWGEMRLHPARLPIRLVTALPYRDRLLPRVFPVLAPFFRTTTPTASLREVVFRGRVHAAMIYDDLPIIDYFAVLGADERMGCMQRQGDQHPFFFRLLRESLHHS